MSQPFRISTLAWLVLPLVAIGCLAAIDVMHLHRVTHVTGLFAEPPQWDAGSPTGYAGGMRRLIVPLRNNDTYHWIAQTQLMVAQGDWRLRHVAYDNAPLGRPVETPSPYRWWLAFTGWVDHAFSGEPSGAAIENAALFADPLLHGLLIIATLVFVAWQFGQLPAALGATAAALLYPFAGWFVPGAADDSGLGLLACIWSLLPLLAGVRNLGDPARQPIRWFWLAGVAGGLGTWVSVSSEVPVLGGVFLGALIAAATARLDNPGGTTGARWGAAWQAWSLGGAVTVLVTSLIEYYPGHLATWQLREVHPLYGLAWLGLGGVLGPATVWLRGDKTPGRVRQILSCGLGLAAVAALPAAMARFKNEGFLAIGTSSIRLAKLPGSPEATSLLAWLERDGVTAQAWATLLPALLVVPAAWMLFRRTTGATTRAIVAIALGPVLVALILAGKHLNRWSLVDATLVALLVGCAQAIGAPGRAGYLRWSWAGAVGLVSLLGFTQLWPGATTTDKIALNRPELVGLIERDLANWLARHAGPHGAVVLAPPSETTAMYYYAGLRGLGTLAWENEEGIRAAIRIVSASTPEEAKELIKGRGVTHLVIPSWDSYLDEYARLGMGQLEGTFLARLHAWWLPPWLKPVAYQFPVIPGFEGQSVTILEVVEDQPDAAALSRVAEYFIETGQVGTATAVSQSLRQFPADLSALVARAEVEFARGEMADFNDAVEKLQPRIVGVADRRLPWDRRVSLAVILAQAKQMDAARRQVQRCLESIDEAKLRSLSTGSLYRLQVLCKAFGLPIADPRLHALALDLLPPDLRQRL
ncbi:MAG TPA: hypothetical protein VG936_08830 [Lacunisphaera sp.]|nr:hypothetical protein [Lacunisphaera sp.]